MTTPQSDINSILSIFAIMEVTEFLLLIAPLLLVTAPSLFARGKYASTSHGVKGAFTSKGVHFLVGEFTSEGWKANSFSGLLKKLVALLIPTD